MTPIFPNMMTLGKLVQGKTPENILKAADTMENKKGKLAYFNASDICEIDFAKKDDKGKKALRKLVEMGMLEPEDGSSRIRYENRKYRLTSTARQALYYI